MHTARTALFVHNDGAPGQNEDAFAPSTFFESFQDIGVFFHQFFQSIDTKSLVCVNRLKMSNSVFFCSVSQKGVECSVYGLTQFPVFFFHYSSSFGQYLYGSSSLRLYLSFHGRCTPIINKMARPPIMHHQISSQSIFIPHFLEVLYHVSFNLSSTFSPGPRVNADP